MSDPIGVVGRGAVGGATDRHLLAAGRTVHGFDTDPDRRASFEDLGAIVHPTAADLAEHGIRVNAIGPGPVVTERTRPRWDDPDAPASTEARTPMGGMGRAEELVGGVVYLLSHEASFTTGTTLSVDGGWTAM